MTSPRETVGVIGSGVAGLTAAHLLQRRYDVTLFEADDRLGGHAHTHELTASDGGTTHVDSGFIVHNDRTYRTCCGSSASSASPHRTRTCP
jgi:predicted NAD/FAD-binding protein